jgi:hypothetical protein
VVSDVPRARFGDRMGTQDTLEEVGSRLPPARERTGKLEHRPPSGKLRSSPDRQMRWRSPRFPRSAASRLGALALCGLAIGVAALAGCGESAPPPSGQPTFYQDLAQTDAAVDAAVAQSMISGYRSNNGLGPVVVDSDLMRLAGEQARAMAARDKMDHDVGHPFHERMRKRASAAALRSRTSAPAITRSPRLSPVGAIRRRIAPICSTAASLAWELPRPMLRLRNTRCSGR